MAIRIISGVPGAGKSFYAVNHIAKHYCKSVGDTFELKPDFMIVTNIDSLMLDTVDLVQAIEKSGSLESFFSDAVQEKTTKKYQSQGKRLVYVIDEAQQYFHRRYYDRGVFSFFENHRHYGLDIFLITQNSNLLAKDLLSLMEFEIRAVPRTLAIGGFNYLRKSNKEIIGRSYLKRDKKIFNLYKSMQAVETEKIRSPYWKYIIPIVLLLLFGLYGLKNSFFGRAMGWAAEDDSLVSSTQRSSASANTLKKNSVIQDQSTPELWPFVPVSYTRFGSQLLIYNTETKDLCPVSLFPYEVKPVASGRSVRLYARMPQTEKKEN